MRQTVAQASEGGNVKRRLLIVAVFLLAGAVVNVAVAWGCVTWVPLDQALPPYFDVFPEEYGPILRQIPGGPWRVLGTGQRSSGIGVHLECVWVRRAGTYPPPYVTAIEVQCWGAGLPLVTLEGCHAKGPGLRWRHVAVIPPSWLRSQPLRILPLRALWPGFAVNTLFYAGVLWLLIPGPFVLRRFVRVKRGRCVKCGYPMGESAVCSECGKALPGRAKVAT